MNNQQLHEQTCKLLNEVYVKKNRAYGDSFNRSIDDFGYVAALVRINDKLERLKTLLKTNEVCQEEPTKDSALDLANYAIMLYMRLLKDSGQSEASTDTADNN